MTTNPTCIEIIEKASKYWLQSSHYLDKSVYVGSRKRLAQVLLNTDPELILATYGTSKKCIILIDLELGEMMDLIAERKYLN